MSIFCWPQRRETSCALVADRGELFVWGKNVRGCLGIGKRDDQYFPWRVRPQGLLPLEGKTTSFTSPGG